MKKVINVEIARQVFWIEEQAYAKLNTYLQKITEQLKGQEMANEIHEDIELRIAELLYPYGTNQRSIHLEQVEATIEQIGYLEDDNADKNPVGARAVPIIGGVCSALANRHKVSVSLIRFLFIAVSFLFGLGIFIYGLLWFLIRPNRHFGSVTAKEIATSSNASKPPLFLRPLHSIFNLFTQISTRKHIRWPYFLVLSILSIFAMSLGLEFWAKAFFPLLLSIIICISGLMCLAAIWVISIQKLILLDSRVNQGILLTLLIGSIGVVWGSIELNLAHAHTESQSFTYVVPQKKHYEITLIEPKEWGETAEFEVVPLSQGQPNLAMTYSADGKDRMDAKSNLQSIEYNWTILDNKILLNTRHHRQKGSLSRGQKVFIQIHLPQGSTFQTTSDLQLKGDARQFSLASSTVGFPQKYAVYANTIIKLGPSNITEFDRQILRDFFCETFYVPSPKPCSLRLANPPEVQDLRPIYANTPDPIIQLWQIIISDFNEVDLENMIAEVSQLNPQPRHLLDFAQQLAIERNKAH